MANFSLLGSTGKQVIISIRGRSHEVCVAATQTSYWEQLTKGSGVTISTSGAYVPVELEEVCSIYDEPRLQLIVRSQSEQDNKLLDQICTQIRCDLGSFENNDRPVYNWDTDQLTVFGSLYNSLSADEFDTERRLLGQRNFNIKRIRNHLTCSVVVTKPMSQRYKFDIHHSNHTIMDIAAIQIQALVKQTQYEYVSAFALKIGRSIVGPIEKMESMETSASSLSTTFPSFTSFQPIVKRKRDEEEPGPTTNGPAIIDSDQSDDETIPDETREQHRQQAEYLLNCIYERMQARTPVDHVAKAREDSSQIKTYFRHINTPKDDNDNSTVSIELVEHEKDLRARQIHEHKCTLVFNKQLKMGPGIRDRIKKTAKVRAYEQLKSMTRDIPRDALILKKTLDGLWKAKINPRTSE